MGNDVLIPGQFSSVHFTSQKIKKVIWQVYEKI